IVPVERGGDFSIADVINSLAELRAQQPPPRFIVIDTRGANLTAEQLRALNAAIATLPGYLGRRVVRLADPR
ncbi:MAG: hypothetical protein ACRCSO_05160, partial [Sphingomonas sp.]